MASELSGLTRLALACMDQQISFQILGEMTHINPVLLSNYAAGKRQISRHHLPILSVALGIPAVELRTLAPHHLVFVDEHEMSEANPIQARVNHRLMPWYPGGYLGRKVGVAH